MFETCLGELCLRCCGRLAYCSSGGGTVGVTATYIGINNGIIVCLRHVGVVLVATVCRPRRLIDDGVHDDRFGVILCLCAATDGGRFVLISWLLLLTICAIQRMSDIVNFSRIQTNEKSQATPRHCKTGRTCRNVDIQLNSLSN